METKKRSRLARTCLTGVLLAMLAGSALAGSVLSSPPLADSY